jgi:hypothetical protein
MCFLAVAEGKADDWKGVVKRWLDGAVEVSASAGIYGESPSRRHLCQSRSGGHASLYHIEHHAASAMAWLTSRLTAAAQNVATALLTTEERALGGTIVLVDVRFVPNCEVPTGSGNVRCWEQTGRRANSTNPPRMTRSRRSATRSPRRPPQQSLESTARQAFAGATVRP